MTAYAALGYTPDDHLVAAVGPFQTEDAAQEGVDYLTARGYTAEVGLWSRTRGLSPEMVWGPIDAELIQAWDELEAIRAIAALDLEVTS